MEDKGVDGIEIGRGGLSDASDADRGLAESLRRQLRRHGEISTCWDGWTWAIDGTGKHLRRAAV